MAPIARTHRRQLPRGALRDTACDRLLSSYWLMRWCSNELWQARLNDFGGRFGKL